MLNLCAADWAPHFVDYMNGETRSEAFRKVNPMGEIPLLEHNGMILTQSGVILDYLAETLGKFGPNNEAERREILRWILFDNHKLTSYTATLRFIRALTDQGESAVTEFLETRSKAALNVLDNHLKRSQFAIGDRITTADFSMCGYLFFRDEIGIDFSSFPNIIRWLEDIKSMDGWVHPYELMPAK